MLKLRVLSNAAVLIAAVAAKDFRKEVLHETGEDEVF